MSAINAHVVFKFAARLLRTGLLCIFLIYDAQAKLVCPVGCPPGQWSVEAIDLSSPKSRSSDRLRDIRISSPDRHKALRLVGDRLWVEIDGHKISISRPRSDFSEAAWAEAAWSPDSTKFYVTQSVGYSTGYRTYLYSVEGKTVKNLYDINRVVKKHFEQLHGCTAQDPNIAGLKWLAEPSELLLVAEVPPIGGICKHMKYFRGYLVSIRDGHIIKTYSPQELVSQWDKVLGERLQSNFQYLSVEEKAMKP